MHQYTHTQCTNQYLVEVKCIIPEDAESSEGIDDWVWSAQKIAYVHNCRMSRWLALPLTDFRLGSVQLAQVAVLQPSWKYPNLRQVSHVLVENL